MNNDYDINDMNERVKATNSRALRNKEESYKNIRSRYHDWRIKRCETKISNNKEKLEKLEKNLNIRIKKYNKPSVAYKVYTKGKTKFERLLALTQGQLKVIKSYVNDFITNYIVADDMEPIEQSLNKRVDKAETPTDFKVNDDVDIENDKQQEQEEELETPTDFKVSDEVDMESDKSDQEEKMELSDDAINEEFDKAIELNNKDIVSNKTEQKENNNDVPLLPDNNTNIKFDSVVNEQPKENGSNIEKGIDKDKIISAEEVNKDLNSNNNSENYSTYTASSSDIIITPERIPYIGVNYELKDEKSNRDDEIKQRFEDINTAMHGIEADRYFAKSDANYIDKQIEEIMNSIDLDYAQKKEKLQSIIKEQKEKEEQQQKAIEQKRIEKENLEKKNLEAMVTNIRNGITKQNELIDMLAEEDERVSSLEDELNSSIGTR